jgi:hypothetical protein
MTLPRSPPRMREDDATIQFFEVLEVRFVALRD